MRLTNVEASIKSSHSYLQEVTRNESLQSWQDEPGRGADPPQRRLSSPVAVGDRLTLSQQALDQLPAAATGGKSAEEADSSGEEVQLDPRLQAIKWVLEALIGRRIDLVDLQSFSNAGQSPAEAGPGPAPDAQSEKAGWGMTYDFSAAYTEEENTSVAASGTLQTGDNREITFSVDLVMDRQFTATEELHLRAGDAVATDPLVLNLEGAGADFSKDSFSFDLNADGRKEQLASLKPGSGYLALDLNGDGRVNNGHELFGPKTGNGFQELRALDSDSNGWLDENDPMFDRLRIWIPDGAAAGLYTLDEKKVGALLLDSAASEFMVKDPDNATLARIRQTGLFFYEDGQAGTIQQVDLVG